MRSLISLTALFALTAFAGEGQEAPDDWASRPHQKFEGGEKAFQAVKQELLSSYLKADLTEDDLYRAAVEGMLSQIDPPMRPYNKLLSPQQSAELMQDMKGEVVGVGVMLKFDEATGRAEVTGVLPGGPAEKGDVREGDVLLSVDGHGFKGRSIRDVVTAVRGKAGEKVTLSVLRDATVLTKVLVRQKVNVEQVSFELLPSKVALLSIRAFGEPTPEAVRAALLKVKQAKPLGLVVDLRGNEGGLLEKAVETAKLLLPKGAVVTKLLHRGGQVEVRSQDGEPVLPAMPTVVLIDGETRSSGELMAAALRAGLKAPLIGAHTAGKWSVQQLKELPNGFVVRYTVANFEGPDGKAYEREGLPADIEVALDEASAHKAARAKTAAERLTADAQLRAAVNFLQLR